MLGALRKVNLVVPVDFKTRDPPLQETKASIWKDKTQGHVKQEFCTSHIDRLHSSKMTLDVTEEVNTR